jgi:hypothetical protein
MKSGLVLMGLLLAFASGCASQGTNYVFEVVDYHPGPVIKKGDPGTEENKYGFEGGMAFKFKGQYHMFTAEMAGEPAWVKMRLAHWKSKDGVGWERISTLYESSGVDDGSDSRAALWAPMPYYNEQEGRWNLFYVAYRCDPGRKDGWYVNYEGRIWRAVSTVPGIEGLDGPYKDVGVILEPGPDSDEWEGLQGTDSFHAYRVDDQWYGFYGSAHTEKATEPGGCDLWGVGLVKAATLAGPWKRLSELNPVPIDKVWVENPVVTQLEDGIYIAVFDGGPRGSFAYSVSEDGVHWGEGVAIALEPKVKRWWQNMRTPLGLIPEGDGLYTVFYTAFAPAWNDPDRFGNVGMVRLRLKKQAYTDYWLMAACDRI